MKQLKSIWKQTTRGHVRGRASPALRVQPTQARKMHTSVIHNNNNNNSVHHTMRIPSRSLCSLSHKQIAPQQHLKQPIATSSNLSRATFSQKPQARNNTTPSTTQQRSSLASRSNALILPTPVRLATRFTHTSKIALSESYSVHLNSDENNESTPFDFTPENYQLAKKIIAKYPEGYQKGAMIPLLDLAQRQHNGWLPLAAMNKVAKILDVPPMAVYEVASFYTMFNRTPIKKFHVQICTTTPCMLRGAYEVLSEVKKVSKEVQPHLWTVGEVECAGACVNAPVMSVGDDYYEDLTPQTARSVLEAFARGEVPKRGPQNSRNNCEPEGGLTSLIEEPLGPYSPFLDQIDKEQKQ